jgi:hypothetical protein
MLTLRDSPPASPPARPRRPAPGRRPFRDNPFLILLGIALLIAALAATFAIGRRPPSSTPYLLP